MDARTLFSLLKTQDVPVHLLRQGDVVDLDHVIAEVRSVTHYNEGEYDEDTGECVVIEWEGDDDGTTLIVPAYLPGSDCKWCDYTIVVRDSLEITK